MSNLTATSVFGNTPVPLVRYYTKLAMIFILSSQNRVITGFRHFISPGLRFGEEAVGRAQTHSRRVLQISGQILYPLCHQHLQ
ncbi:hypothetical protein PoB_003941000 [Plakobranchus ocellatus]|uniref:Bestrophin homolog n=1 Tax=Plakobranchus ocellatus TaxID=259542 RepID=A0AAV4B043_9GAST|nr:hypothetical protein PoB_003941000 [Plakobranchus ocellatus]